MNMKKWEYEVIYTTRSIPHLETLLCELGNNGWDLVSTLTDDSHYGFILKRERGENSLNEETDTYRISDYQHVS